MFEDLKKNTFEKHDAFTVGEVFNMKKDELGEIAWLPADVELIEKIGTELGE